MNWIRPRLLLALASVLFGLASVARSQSPCAGTWHGSSAQGHGWDLELRIDPTNAEQCGRSSSRELECEFLIRDCKLQGDRLTGALQVVTSRYCATHRTHGSPELPVLEIQCDGATGKATADFKSEAPARADLVRVETSGKPFREEKYATKGMAAFYEEARNATLKTPPNERPFSNPGDVYSYLQGKRCTPDESIRNDPDLIYIEYYVGVRNQVFNCGKQSSSEREFRACTASFEKTYIDAYALLKRFGLAFATGKGKCRYPPSNYDPNAIEWGRRGLRDGLRDYFSRAYSVPAASATR